MLLVKIALGPVACSKLESLPIRRKKEGGLFRLKKAKKAVEEDEEGLIEELIGTLDRESLSSLQGYA
jgi:hypothetical protein